MLPMPALCLCSEDEFYRKHAQPLGQQRGDDAILDYFHSLGAKVCNGCCSQSQPALLLVFQRACRFLTLHE